MKSFLNIMLSDLQKENFSKRECVVYGALMPIVLIVAIIVAEIINK